jgi:hypothetical protein
MGYHIDHEVLRSEYKEEDGSDGPTLVICASSVSGVILVKQNGNYVYFDKDLLRKFLERMNAIV